MTKEEITIKKIIMKENRRLNKIYRFCDKATLVLVGISILNFLIVAILAFFDGTGKVMQFLSIFGMCIPLLIILCSMYIVGFNDGKLKEINDRIIKRFEDYPDMANSEETKNEQA